MYIVHVLIHIKPEAIEDFRKATIINAQNSNKEPGIIRFDFLQQQDDPTRYTLVEIYRTPEDQLKHRETSHYNAWKDTVAEMMAEPRVGVKFSPIYPDESSWE